MKKLGPNWYFKKWRGYGWVLGPVRIWLLLGAVGLARPAACAQETWSLPHCLSFYQEHSTKVLQDGFARDRARLQLQASTDGQKSWAAVGTPVAADATGKATFRPTITATSAYRVTWQRYRQLSPSSSLVGSVFVAPAASPAPQARSMARP